jgi:hypothetical protein
MTIDKPSPMLRQLHIDQFARPLRVVGLANFVVIFFWIKALGIFIVDALAGELSVLFWQVFWLILIPSFGFSAWVCWRTVDVISTVTDPLIRISYLTVGTICLAWVLIASLAFMVSGTIGDAGTNVGVTNVIGGQVFILFLGTITLLAARSLKRLRRIKIDNTGITLEELVRSIHPTAAKGTRWFTTFHGLKSPGVIRFLVIAVILLIIYSGMDLYVKSALDQMTFGQPIAPEVRFLANASQYVFLGACYFALRARVKLQPTAESILSMDRRTPVLFLRSFVDDERVRFLHAQRTLFDFSLEARLATHFFKTGPFIAVDSPNHTAAIGAARAALSDTEWQGTVVDWMRAARLIVLFAGVSHWIRWEMRQIVELGYSRKLIILMPELSRWRQFRLRRDIASKRLEVIRETFSGSPWEASINEPCVPEKIRSLMFGPGGQVTAVCARSRSRDCHQLAALISEYLILQEARESAESKVKSVGEIAIRVESTAPVFS